MLRWIDREAGLKVLSIAGTNPNFRGLVQTVEESKPADPSVLKRLPVEFKAVSEIAPLTEQMVVMDELFEKIGKGIEQYTAQNTQPTAEATPKDDKIEKDSLKLADTALLLTESYIELLRTTNDSKAEYLQLLEHGRNLSEQLETALRRKPLQAKQSWTQLKENCTRCHQKFRDNTGSLAK
jgi:cytochrome c556